ncbi:MAG: GldG family protein [Candidatus Glassbacteria bacterium]
MSRGRYLKHTANSFVAIISVLAILSVLNYITNNHKGRFDTTEKGRFSLSDQTVKVLKGLEKDVKAYAFFQGIDRRLDDMFNNYAYHTDRFSYEFVDPDKKPELAKAYNVDKYGTVILTCEDRDEKVEENTEQGVTNTILKVSRESQKVLYFLEGHGERDLENIEREGYSTVKKAIENENYVVKPLAIAREDSIPSDCSALIIASPRARPFDRELELIEGYLQGGGSVLMLLDPPPSEGLQGFVDGWGIKVGNDLVIDASGVGRLFGAGPTIPLISDYENHAITKGFRVMTFFPNTRSVEKKDDVPAGVKVISLCRTTRNSWAETDPEGTRFEFDEDRDKRGPISIAAIATKEIKSGKPEEGEEEVRPKTARLVVFGDADFASNSYFHASGNSDLFLNTISWLAEEEDLISIRPREPEDRRLTLTARQTKSIFYFSIVFMPLVIIGIGAFVWSRKR